MEGKKDGIFFQITPIGEVDDAKEFKVSIQVPFEVGWIERMQFLVNKGEERMTFQLKHIKNNDEQKLVFFEGNVVLKTYAIYYVCFSFESNRIFRYFKRKDITNKNCITKQECWKMSVGFEVPEWAKGANMYHIFVDRYRKGGNKILEVMPRRNIHNDWNEFPVVGQDADGNWNIDFFGGNLKGIEETIKYLKSMGITLIYLSPIMRSQSNHRYDTGDYEEVDPYVGTNEELKQLCEVCHKNGIYVILDAVFNHTGNDSKYFNEYGSYNTIGAYQSDNSPYSCFYKKYWDGSKFVFSYWWGIRNLPECDGYSPEWQSYIFDEGGIIDQWFALGIDGLRADVADELTDYFIERIRIAIRRNNSQGLFIGEVWKNPMRMNREYISSGKGMDSVMNYFLVDSLIRYFKYSDVDKLQATFNEILTEYPDDTILTLMNFTSTHDISRAIEIFGCNEFKKYGEWAWDLKDEDLDLIKKHKLTAEQYKLGRMIFEAYFATLTFLPGIISVFYGDEVGIQGLGNLANRAPYPWGKRDKKLLKFVKRCLKIRKEEKFLKKAQCHIISIDSEKIAFERINDKEKILVVVSRTYLRIKYEIPSEYQKAKVLYSQRANREYLESYGCIVLKI